MRPMEDSALNTVDSTSNTPRLRRTQRSTLMLLVAAGTLNYFDRSALPIANPLIREELGLSIAEMGLCASAG